MSRILGFIHDHLQASGHQVDYLCAEDIPAALSGGISRFAFPALVHRRAMAAARAGQPYDIINVHEPSAALVAAFKRSAGNPAVVVISHGVEKRGWELKLEEHRLGREKLSLKTRVIYPLTSLWQSRLGLKRADHIFCLNSEDQAYLMREFDIAGDKITRIYPGADTIYAAVAEGRDYTRAERLLFAGTWLNRKGIRELISAFEVLATRHPRLSLTVLGGGKEEEHIREAFPASLRSRVMCSKATNEEDTAAVFASADIFILPSLFEGTPLTLMEAMMSGLPIVTTATCGMKDVIRDHENGLLVPIRSSERIVEAVERLRQDSGYRAGLGLAVRAEALEKFTWERVSVPVSDAYEQLYERKIHQQNKAH